MFQHDDSDSEDPGAVGRGVLFGVALGVLFWGALFTVYWYWIK